MNMTVMIMTAAYTVTYYVCTCVYADSSISNSGICAKFTQIITTTLQGSLPEIKVWTEAEMSEQLYMSVS
jgi:hypothetical protein